jgi:hypothetical protein
MAATVFGSDAVRSTMVICVIPGSRATTLSSTNWSAVTPWFSIKALARR